MGRPGPKKRAAKTPAAPPPEPRPASIDNDQDLAKRYKVTPKTVYAWRQAGLPHTVDGRRHVYELAKADEWVGAHRSEVEREKSPLGTRLKLRREKERIKQERLKTAAMRRADAIEQGNILPRDEWELFAIEIIQQTRDRFMRLPKLLCKLVPSKFHKVLQSEGTAEVRKICEEMGRVVSEGVKE